MSASMEKHYSKFTNFFDASLEVAFGSGGDSESGAGFPEIICSASANGKVYLGDAEGAVTMHRGGESEGDVRKFQAHRQRVCHMCALQSQEVLVTLGDGADPRLPEVVEAGRAKGETTTKLSAYMGRTDAKGNPLPQKPELRVWMLESWDENGPSEARRFTVDLEALGERVGTIDNTDEWSFGVIPQVKMELMGTTNPWVSALSVSEDLSLLAVGLSSGRVVLYRGDLRRERGELGTQLVVPGGGMSRSPVTNVFFASVDLSDASNVPVALRGKGAARKGGGGGRSGLSGMFDQLGAGDRQSPVLYVTTSKGVYSSFPGRSPPGADAGEGNVPLLNLDEVGVAGGCGPGGATLADGQVLVMAGRRGVHFFGPESSGGFRPSGGAKVRVLWHGRYLALASADTAGRQVIRVLDVANKLLVAHLPLATAGARAPRGDPGAAAARAASLAVAAACGAGDGASEAAAYAWKLYRAAKGNEVPTSTRTSAPSSSAALAETEVKPSHVCLGIAGGWTAGGVELTVYSSGGLVHRLRERPTEHKLDTLFRSRRFDVAILLANAEDGTDRQRLRDIHRMYGDFLLDEDDDADNAVLEYCATIGGLEPAYVVRRFLRPPRLQHLTVYLEALHAAGHAVAEHTALLLRCYARGRNRDKLSRFIRGDVPVGSEVEAVLVAAGANVAGGETEVTFDADAAIAVLREAGFSDLAAELAARSGRAAVYVETLVSGLSSVSTPAGEVGARRAACARALRFLATQEPTEAERGLLRHAATLAMWQPLRTAVLAARLCAGFVPSNAASASVSTPPAPLRLPAARRQLDAALAEATPAARRSAPRTDPARLLGPLAARPGALRALLAWMAEIAPSTLTAHTWHALLDLEVVSPPPSAEEEERQACAADGLETPDDDTSSSTALAAKPPSGSTSTATDDREERVLKNILANRSARLDPALALVACSEADYDRGVLYLLETTGKPEAAVEFWFDETRAALRRGDVAAAQEARHTAWTLCRQHATTRPWLWVSTLDFLAETYRGGGETIEFLRGEHLARHPEDKHPSELDLLGNVVRQVAAETGALDSGVAERLSSWRAVEEEISKAEASLEAKATSERARLDNWYLVNCIKAINTLSLLSPLMVVHIVASNPRIPLSVIQPFIAEHLEAQEKAASTDRTQLDTLRDKTDLMLEELRTLETRGKVFRQRRSRESGAELMYPSIHFMCGSVRNGELLRDPKDREHSFNTEDFLDAPSAAVADELDGALACPQCEAGLRAATERKRQMIQGALDDEKLHRELDAAPEGFHVVSEYLEKGLFDDAVIQDVADAADSAETVAETMRKALQAAQEADDAKSVDSDISD